MKYWIYAEPVTAFSSEPVWQILSDKAIIASYFDYWSGKMKGAHKEHLITYEDCILDWVATHWAVEATPETLLRIISDGQ